MTRRDRSKEAEHLIGTPPVQLDKNEGAFIGIDSMRLERWRRIFPLVDIERQIIEAAGWAMEAGPKGRKKNYPKFLWNWFKNRQREAEADQPEKDTGGRSSRWM